MLVFISSLGDYWQIISAIVLFGLREWWSFQSKRRKDAKDELVTVNEILSTSISKISASYLSQAQSIEQLVKMREKLAHIEMKSIQKDVMIAELNQVIEGLKKENQELKQVIDDYQKRHNHE